MKIVVLDGYALNPGDLSWHGIEEFGELTIHERTPVHQILSRSDGADILFTNKTPISREIIAALPNLKFIGVLATGYNIIDLQAAKEHGVVVSNAPGYGTDSVAQFCFALLLEFCNQVKHHSEEVKKGRWSRSADFCFWDFPQTELAGKTLGIVGFGSIGRRVAEIAACFGMKVIATSRTHTDESHRPHFRWVDYEELFRESDFITLHCPLTPETLHLVNKEKIALMKPTAFLINTARGPIVCEEDLAEALNQKRIAGAAVDVLPTEPPVHGSPLIGARNCLITPHIAWAGTNARRRLMEISVLNLRSFLAGNPVNVVNA